jgi:hypothetical protein
MSLDDRLRADLREIAADVDPSVETALRSVFAARDRRARVRAVLPRVLVAAACLVLVSGLLTWWLTSARGDDDDIVIEPQAPSGTYEATFSGDLAGVWRLRFLDGRMSLVAPDTGVLGSRATSAPYEIEGRTLTTRLLEERCGGPGSYTWEDSDSLRLQVQDDDCDLRVRLLTDPSWSLVTGGALAPGTYGTPPLSIERMRSTALAEGFRRKDVDAYLVEQFPDVTEVTYTIDSRDGVWTVYDAEDVGADTLVAWSGDYVVPDAGTVVADAGPPCSPIVYDYRLSGDGVAFALVDDPCPELVGEMIAQTIIYESAPYRRLE